MANPNMTLAMHLKLDAQSALAGLGKVRELLAEIEGIAQKTGAGLGKASDGLAAVDKDAQTAVVGLGKVKDGLTSVDSAAQKAGGSKMTDLIESIKDATRRTSDLVAGLAKVAAGATAGFYAINKMAQPAMEYDKRLALMANTAFSGRDTSGRIAGKAELDAMITGAVRKGGGSRDQAAETLDKLLASGAMTLGSAASMLPTLQKFSSATGADPAHLADIAIRGKQTFGLTDAQLGTALDKAVAAGQAGGFELRDMSRWLPKQMAAAKMSGITGMAGFESLLAWNQASAITAGTKDEAGNNLANILLKINSRDTAGDAKKLGIDLSGTLAAANAKGVNSMDAFIGLVSGIADRDPKLLKLRQQAVGLEDSELKANLTAQSDILQGQAIGKLVQDQQALLALVGVMNKTAYIAEVRGRIAHAEGEGARSFGTVSATGAYKSEQIKNEKDIAMQRVVDASVPTAFMDKLIEAAREFPKLTTAVAAATAAAVAMATAIGASGLAGILMGKGGAGAAGAAASAAGGMGKLAKLGVGAALVGGTAATVAGAGAAGYYVGGVINDKLIAGTKTGEVIGSGVAKTLAFFGNEDAKRAITLTEKLKDTKVGGEIHVKIDSEGRPRQVQATSRNAAVPIRASVGHTMALP